MGLTAYHMSDVSRLARLAEEPQAGTSREEIYLAVASLYRIQGTGLNRRERDLMRDILHRLTRDVEMAIRIALAERLAGDPTVPHDLVLLLVDDVIEVARPLILRSPLLTEADMLRLIAGAGVAHQEAVAARPGIGPAVTDALTHRNCDTVLVALVRNATAQFSNDGFRRLVEKSRTLTALQEPLARRPDLPFAFADMMCEWVSDTLKLYIRAHYPPPSGTFDAALQSASDSLRQPPPPATDLPSGSARKLVEKLAMSGQLKTGFLIRVLNQSQGDLFDLAFAQLLEMELAPFRAVFYAADIRPAALACRAVGIDRSAFATVYDQSRRTHGIEQTLTSEQMKQAAATFDTYTRPAALAALKNAAS